MIRLKSFTIRRLNNEYDVRIPFVDNRLVLVGDNGQGKSTIVNLLYLFLTRQWKRMITYSFESLELRINTSDLLLTRAELLGFLELEDEAYARKHLSSRSAFIFRRLLIEQGPQAIERLSDPNIAKDLFRRYGFHPSMLADLKRYIEQKNISGIRKIPELTEALTRELGTTTILFLPTYRRIEQDLEYIIPSLPRNLQKLEDEEHPEQSAGPSFFIEFARFGMTDVEQLLKSRSAALRDRARTRLNNLLGTYLRDVINERYTDIDKSVLNVLNPEAVEQIVFRVEDSMLTTEEKNILIEKVRELKREKTGLLGPQTRLSQRDKIVLHFLNRLIQTAGIQRSEEEELRQFAEVCNHYLSRKEIRLDELSLELAVFSTTQEGRPSIDWRLLSSGEKQVISLFAHVFLAEQAELLVIIDEPELSLSVEWQRRFLPDLISSSRCIGMLAVTHSPYIFENSLDLYARSISESLLTN